MSQRRGQCPSPWLDLAPSTPARFPEKLTDATSFITVQTAPHKWSKPPSEGAIHPGPRGRQPAASAAPHWADCAAGSPSKLPAAGAPPRPGRFLDGILFSSVASPAQETSCASRTFPQHRSDFPRTQVPSTISWEAVNQPRTSLRRAPGAARRPRLPRAVAGTAAGALRDAFLMTRRGALSTLQTGTQKPGRGNPAMCMAPFCSFCPNRTLRTLGRQQEDR